MRTLDVVAMAVAAAATALDGRLRRPSPDLRARTRGSRFVLWLALAAPIPFLLLAPTDRPRVLVAGRAGGFEALGLLAFSAAAAAAVESLVDLLRPAARGRGAFATALQVLLASLLALAVVVAWVFWGPRAVRR